VAHVDWVPQRGSAPSCCQAWVRCACCPLVPWGQFLLNSVLMQHARRRWLLGCVPSWVLQPLWVQPCWRVIVKVKYWRLVLMFGFRSATGSCSCRGGIAACAATSNCATDLCSSHLVTPWLWLPVDDQLFQAEAAHMQQTVCSPTA
jgi:hypothetical protein